MRPAGNEILLRQALRFGVTGIAATATHTVIALLAVEAAALDPAPANGIAFAMATILSYTLNTLWSFSARPGPKTLFRFSVVSLAGMGLAMLIAGYMGSLGYSNLLGILSVALLVPPATFLMHRLWTYRS
jgi:putative flippase GtrA